MIVHGYTISFHAVVCNLGFRVRFFYPCRNHIVLEVEELLNVCSSAGTQLKKSN